MENDILIVQRELMLEDGKKVSLHYYVTAEIGMDIGKTYGIRIEKRGELLEVEKTGPISQSMEWVKQICRRIADNVVTPIGLIDIVDDLITEM